MIARRALLWLLPAVAVGLLVADPFLEQSFQKRLEKSRSAWRTFAIPGTDWNIAGLAVDGQGHVWVAGMDRGLAVFDGKGWSIYDAHSGLAGGDVRAIAFDDQGQVWVGTDRGLSIFNGTSWKKYGADKSDLVDTTVWTIEFDAQGRAWLGTDAGLKILDGTTRTAYTPGSAGLPCPWVGSIAFDATGRAWIGSVENDIFGSGCGLTVFDGTTWTTFTAANSGLASDDVSVVAFDRAGRAWIGTLEHTIFGPAGEGVSVYNGKVWTSFTHSNSGLPSNLIFDLAFDSQARMWIATRSLSVYDGRGWKTYSPSNSGLASAGAEAVAFDSAGRIWAVGADLHGNAVLSVLDPEGADPPPGFATDLRQAVFAPDVRLYVPSLLLVLWLGLLLRWHPVLAALVALPGLISIASGGPLVCACTHRMEMTTGIVVTYGASAGALFGSLIQGARSGTRTAHSVWWGIVLAIAGAVVAFILDILQTLPCSFEYIWTCP